MSLLRTMWNRLRLRGRADEYRSELDEEMRLHRELVEQELVRDGVAPAEARRQAALRLGNSGRLREESWRVIDLGVSGLWRDLRFAARQLRRSPGFTLAAVLTLALGVGAVTVIFSVAYGVLIDPFPYKDVQTLATPALSSPEFGGRFWDYYTPAQFLEIEQKTDLFSGVTASTISDVTLTGTGLPQHLRGNDITPNTFAVLGVAPELGRASTEDDVLPGHAEVALISDRYWKTHFGASRSVLGRVMTLNGEPRVVIGVMPPRFLWRGADVYLPFRMVAAKEIEGQPSFALFGRLKPGTTVKGVQAKAIAELTPLLREFLRADPHAFPRQVRVVGVESFAQAFQSGLASTLYLLLGAVCLLLLIACVNVSGLLLARAVGRQHEQAVRTALGASRLRLVRAALAEAALLAAVALPAAWLFAWGGLAATLRLVPPETIPDEAAVSLNLPVLLASIGLALGAVVLAALAPAWQNARVRPAEALRGQRSSRSRGQRRMLRGFLVAEIALSLTLIVLAGMTLRQLLATEQTPLPFDADHTAMLRIELDKTRYPDAAAKTTFFRELLRRTNTLPGVRVATVDSEYPYGNGDYESVQVQGVKPRDVFVHRTGPGYLKAAHLRLLQGRFLDEAMLAEKTPDAVVTASFAKAFWPNGDAMGHSFTLPGFQYELPKNASTTFTVVGIVSDIPRYPGYRQGVPAVFTPYTIAPDLDTLVVATRLSAGQMLHTLEQAVYSVDPDQAVSDAASLQHILDMYGYAGWRFEFALFGAFAGSAIALTLVGLYGVFSFLAAERRQEIGIRMAVGASRASVVRMVLREACLVALAGLGVGLPLALAAARLAQGESSQRSFFDPYALGAAMLLMPAIAILGVLLPAWRAAATDPVKALRIS